MSDSNRVVVAMSGGVDSSVAAALLVRQGYQVIGMMLRLWSEPGSESYNRCCTPDAMAMARRVSAHLGIPFYAVDAQDVFRDTVVQYFLDGYERGVTPNPCLVCNRHIRWEFLLDRALALGADYMATGHYARLQREGQGPVRLLQAVDRAKDQSYVLHVLGQPQLAHALFPLGDYTKPQVRQLAREFELPVAERSESQDLCFLGKDDYRDFLLRQAPQVRSPGPIETQDGQLLGQHQGLGFYTIGQRKGLGIASPDPLYVIRKDLARGALIVGPRQELGRQELLADRVNWVSGEAPAVPFRAQVKIRYKAQEAWGTVEFIDPADAAYAAHGGAQSGNGTQVRVRFDEPLRDITPGQAAVFYDGQVCLGGGIIR